MTSPADLAEVVTVGVVSLTDLAEVVTAGVASSADLAEVVTIGVASSADLAGDATAGVASSVTLLESSPSVWRPQPTSLKSSRCGVASLADLAGDVIAVGVTSSADRVEAVTAGVAPSADPNVNHRQCDIHGGIWKT